MYYKFSFRNIVLQKWQILYSGSFTPPVPQRDIYTRNEQKEEDKKDEDREEGGKADEEKEESGVTYDCNDWSLRVNLSSHPMGPPGQGEGSVSMPEVRRKIFQ